MNLARLIGVALFLSLITYPGAYVWAEAKYDDGYGHKAAPAEMPMPSADGKHEDVEVNGIRFSDYKDFQSKWKLVTVTFRTDAREMRFSYANDLAYETLLNKSTDYPEGAVFIKVSMLTKGDPAFIASEVPSASRRYQVMKRDAERYASTGSWGYAVFASTPWGYSVIGWDGLVKRDGIEEMQAKCHACHTLVKDRGYVFSRIAPVAVNKPGEANTQPLESQDAPKIIFRVTPHEALPEAVRKFIPRSFKNVRTIDAPTSKNHAYIGVAYEARSLMIAEVARSKIPAVYFDEAQTNMIIVYPTNRKLEPVAPDCGEKGELFVSYWRITGNTQQWPSKDLFCYNEQSLPRIENMP